MKPWWFCCGWRSYWCVLDTINDAWLTKVGLHIQWICDRHDEALVRKFDQDKASPTAGR